MKHSKKLLLCVSFLLITVIIGGCGFMNKGVSIKQGVRDIECLRRFFMYL